MNVPRDWIVTPQAPTWPQDYAVLAWANTGTSANNVTQAPPSTRGIPWKAILLGGLAVAGLVALASDSGPKTRSCGACGRSGHDRRNCPLTGPRANFSRSMRKSRRCECCGQSRYETQRHHPRGRADASDRLDVCGDCHIECGHDGHYQNAPRKPRVCRIMNRPSAWRG